MNRVLALALAALLAFAPPTLAADSTVSAMTAASALDGTELYYCVQAGADRKCTGTQVKTLILSSANTFTAANIFSSAAPQLTLGVNATTLGSIKLFGNTSGDVTLSPAAAAGTAVALTLPNATTTIPGLAVANGWTARQGFAAAVPNITLGQTGGNNAQVDWNGSTSGTVSMKTAAAAGTWSMTLPTTAGTVDYVLRTDGTGVTSWVAPGSGTPGGADTQVQFNDGGAFGGDAGLVFNKTTNDLTVGNILSVAAGSKTAPTINFTGQSAGVYSRASGYTMVTNGSIEVFQASSTAMRALGTFELAPANTDLSVSTLNIVTLTSLAGTMSLGSTNNIVQQGFADAAAPSAQTLQAQSVVAGTSNTAGANWTIGGSKGTGTGAGGSIIFQTAPAGTSGTSQNALATAVTIDSAGTLRIKGFTVATLPTAGTAGRLAYVTDQATACVAPGAAITGGGAITCPVFDNGAAWVGM